MVQFLIGVALGFFVATHGVAGVTNVLDKGLQAVKHVNITTEK